MKKIFTIKPIKVDGLTCSAVVGMHKNNNYIYVLTTHAGDNKKKQPCVLHRYGIKDKTYSTSVIKTSSGSTNIAVHANSLTWCKKDGLFYMVTRNGAGPNYNQVLAFDKNGIIKKKFKYYHDKSKIATINYSDKKWYITVTGGATIKMREVSIMGSGFYDVPAVGPSNDISLLLCFNTAVFDVNRTVGNDTFVSDNMIYVTKTSIDDYMTNYIFRFKLNTKGTKKTIDSGHRFYAYQNSSDTEYEKFEVEGIFADGSGLYVAANGVKNGKQADAVWLLGSSWDKL